MLDPVGYVLALCILAAILVLGAVVTVGNERVRQATLQVRQVVHDYALADLAMRRDQARRGFSFASQAECLRVLEQIALDAAGEHCEFIQLAVDPDPGTALVVTDRKGGRQVFTPSAEAFLKANPASGRRLTGRYSICGLKSTPFVVQELEAVAHWHGQSALPRTEEWWLLVMAPEDYSVLPGRRWFGRRRAQRV